MRDSGLGRTLRLSLLLGGFAVACSGTPTPMGGGIAGTSSVLGAISGFGSIFVGGIEFDVGHAVVTIEGDPAQASDLRLGMVTAVRGTVDQAGGRGVAERVAAEHLAQGPLDAVDPASSTLVLLDQQVFVDARTVFDPTPLAGLAANDFIEVSGFFDASGNIRATRIVRLPRPADIELEGFVRDLDAAAMTFRLGNLLVDYSGALLLGAPAEGLQNGLFVDIDSQERPVDGSIVVSEVDVKDPSLMSDPGDSLKVEGFVTEITSPTELVVNARQRVRITPDTRFEHGGPADLALDAQVDIDGIADVDGVLVAGKIDFTHGST